MGKIKIEKAFWVGRFILCFGLALFVFYIALAQATNAEIALPPQVIGAWADGDIATIAYLYENNVTLAQYRRGILEFTDMHTLQCEAQSISVTIAGDAATIFIICEGGWIDARFSQLYYAMAVGVEYRTFMPLVLK